MSKIVLTTLPEEGEFVNWQTPPFFHPTRVNKYMPLGILSLASNLPEHHEVTIFDPSSFGWTIEQTIERIEQEAPDIVGISAITRRAYALGKILPRVSAPYKAVGGPHATYWARQILECGADAVFVGSLADLEFRDAVEDKPTGVIYCQTKINDIRFPRRELLEVDYYFPKASVLFKAENRLPMFSSIGCPNHCTYCNVQSKHLQFKDSEIVVDEMRHLYSVGCRSVHILDDNFNISSKHLKGILEEMARRNFHIEWSGRGQTKMDLRLVKPMAERGFKRIHVGIEALDDKILRYFNKNETVRDVELFCAEMKQNGIEILGYFISGSPCDTEKYRAELPRRIKELGVNYPYFNILFPEPNTPYYQQLLDDGIYPRDYWAEYMENPTPYYMIPYPYGENQKQEVIAYTNELIEEFNPAPAKNSC